jgi:hypothetical protein
MQRGMEGGALESKNYYDGIRSIVIRLEESAKSGLEFGGTHLRLISTMSNQLTHQPNSPCVRYCPPPLA